MRTSVSALEVFTTMLKLGEAGGNDEAVSGPVGRFRDLCREAGAKAGWPEWYCSEQTPCNNHWTCWGCCEPGDASTKWDGTQGGSGERARGSESGSPKKKARKH